MSIRVLTQVWDSDRLKGTELLVLLCLADYANDEGICWPSMGRIAMRTRQSSRNARRMIERLEKKNIIERQLRADETTLYRIKFKALLDQPEETTGAVKIDLGGQVRPGRTDSTGADKSGSQPRSDSTASPVGDDRTPRSGSSAKPSLNRKEPSVEPAPEAAGAAKAPSGPSVSARFMAHWNGNRGQLPKIQEVTEKRRKKLSTRLETPGFEKAFIAATVKASQTSFLLGENRTGWRASFDWMIADDTNYVSVLEGKYDGAAPIARGDQSRPSDASFLGTPPGMATCWADDCRKELPIEKVVHRHFCSNACHERWKVTADPALVSRHVDLDAATEKAFATTSRPVV
jgi:hypothetical protein